MRARDENVAATHLRTAEILWKAGDRLAAAAAYCKAEQNGSGTSIGPQAEAQRARRCSFTREMIDALLKQPQDREDYAALLDWFKVLMALMQPHGPPSRIVDMVEKASVRAEVQIGLHMYSSSDHLENFRGDRFDLANLSCGCCRPQLV
eukprot:SAG31_NODE_4907_length_2874_cov_4.581982_2_plen_149_part_00